MSRARFLEMQVWQEVVINLSSPKRIHDISKETGITFGHVSKLVNILFVLEIVGYDIKNKSKIVSLTEDGESLRNYLLHSKKLFESKKRKYFESLQSSIDNKQN